ncbi:MAG: SCO family protein [Burkholderiales bacterium]|nr:SCO family protein [Burkholderiales bacterium]
MKRRNLIVLSAAMLLTGCTSSNDISFKATDITGTGIGTDFEVNDHQGILRRKADYNGKAIVMFFGFTNCPDVCPTTLSTLSQVMQQMGADSKKIQVFMVTVDPDRDTPELMSKYVPAFDNRFIGLVPTKQQLDELIKKFRLVVQYDKKNSAGFYTVMHTTAAYVFDARGRIRLHVSHETGVDDWVSDLRTLLTTV